jgi:predicted ferric reductase
MSYERWQSVHRLTRLVFLGGAAHAAIEPGTIADFQPLRTWIEPVDRDLRLSIRTVRDFTRRLPAFKSGACLDIYGPFGGFTSHRFAPFRRLVGIGAGIGITPFLGMLAFELSNRDFLRIWLFYVVRDEQEAVYDSEIRESYLEAESYIDYTMWLTSSRGRITAAQVAAEIAPLEAMQ